VAGLDVGFFDLDRRRSPRSGFFFFSTPIFKPVAVICNDCIPIARVPNKQINHAASVEIRNGFWAIGNLNTKFVGSADGRSPAAVSDVKGPESITPCLLTGTPLNRDRVARARWLLDAPKSGFCKPRHHCL
jgi:hypothetical protein